MKFSEKVKILRIEAGLTQQELAKNLGISASAVGFLENGKREPTGSTLIAYSKFFDISIDELVGLVPDIEDPFNPPKGNKIPAAISPDGKELLAIFNGIEPDFYINFAQKTPRNQHFLSKVPT